MNSSMLWRVLFVVAAVPVMMGGPRHPGGTMLEMLQDPEWLPSHALMASGFVLYLIGLWIWGRLHATDGPVRRWWLAAFAAAVLQDVEWVFHTIASWDAARLAAGEATPVLDAHLALTQIAYPLFAIATIGLLLVTARGGTLGSRWVAPLGIAGLACHGVAPFAVLVLEIEAARILFPLLLLFALWMPLAAITARR